ncbi:MAG: tyrosine-type recombinase/integrase [Desulfosalsimonadaceae bacterium]
MTHSLEIAKEIETTISSDILRGKFDIYQRKKENTMDDLFQRYLPYAKDNKKTWADDESIYRRIIQPVFGKKRLSEITPFQLEAFKADLKKRTNRYGKAYAPQTIKNVLVLIKRFYNVAEKWGVYTGKKPMNRVDLPKIDNQKVAFLTSEQTGRLLKTLDSWPDVDARDFIKLAMLTGLRRGEIVKLKFEQVDFENGMVKLLNPKGGKTVSIPISDEAMQIIRRRAMMAQLESDPVFPGRSKNKPYLITTKWQTLRKAAGLEGFRFHDLRHNFASQLVSNGVSLNVVMKLLTHKNFNTTMKYAHLKPEIVKAAAEQSAGIITNTGADVIAMDEARANQ